MGINRDINDIAKDLLILVKSTYSCWKAVNYWALGHAEIDPDIVADIEENENLIMEANQALGYDDKCDKCDKPSMLSNRCKEHYDKDTEYETSKTNIHRNNYESLKADNENLRGLMDKFEDLIHQWENGSDEISISDTMSKLKHLIYRYKHPIEAELKEEGNG